MPDTDFSRTVVVNQTLGKVTRGYTAVLAVLTFGLLATMLWFRLLDGPEWAHVASACFAGGVGTLLGLWARLGRIRRREEGSS